MTALEAITLAEVKAYLRVDFNNEDALITQLIKQSIEWVEIYTQHRIYNREITLVTYLEEVQLFDFPFVSVTSAKDKINVALTYTIVDTGLLLFNTVEYKTIIYNAGYLLGTLPETLRLAIYKIVAFNFDNRLPTTEIPNEIRQSLGSFRRVTWF